MNKLINPNRDMNYRLKKIIRNYNKYGNIVVGVDYDFTLVDSITGEVYQETLDILRRCQRDGIILCIWTANDCPENVKEVWKNNKLNYHYFNESPINRGCIKPHFNILLDDSSGLNESIILLERFLNYLDCL